LSPGLKIIGQDIDTIDFIQTLVSIDSEAVLVAGSDQDPGPNGYRTTSLFNEMIALAEGSVKNQYVVQDMAVSDDFLIKAILWGWDFAFQEYRLKQCFLWGLLEKVDQALYKDCPALARMAHLRKIHRMFMVSNQL
jgi:hypothetical protein